MVHVPYQGGGQLVAAIMATQVQLAFITLPPALPYVKAGRLRVLAVTGPNRMANLPDVPTIGETVAPGFVFHEWHGVVAPRVVAHSSRLPRRGPGSSTSRRRVSARRTWRASSSKAWPASKSSQKSRRRTISHSSNFARAGARCTRRRCCVRRREWRLALRAACSFTHVRFYVPARF